MTPSAPASTHLHLLPPPSRLSAGDDPASPPIEVLIQEMTRRFASNLGEDLDALSQAETVLDNKTGDNLRKPEWTIRLKAAELKLAFLTERLPVPPPPPPSAPAAASFEETLAELHRSPACLQTLLGLVEQVKRG